MAVIDEITYAALAELYRGNVGATRGIFKSGIFKSGIFKSGGVTKSDVSSQDEFAGVILPLDDDEIAAAHHAMFGFNVYPYASAFLEVDGRLGQGVSDFVLEHYERSGCFYGDERETVDHITTELLFCSKLHDHPARLASFLDSHLLQWLPVFAFAVGRRYDAVYGPLAQLTIKYVVDSRNGLPDNGPGGEQSKGPVHGLPGESGDGSHDRSPDKPASWELLTSHFASAWRCGLFLVREDIKVLARRERLPTGFGSRLDMLTTLIESAASYDRSQQVVEGLLDLCRNESAAWQALLVNHPPEALVSSSEMWLTRLAASEKLLTQVPI